MQPSEAFNDAAKRATALPPQPDAVKLSLYALYKQTTVGDAPATPPSVIDAVARTKWDAWAGVRGLDGAQAQTEYINLVDRLDPLTNGTLPAEQPTKSPSAGASRRSKHSPQLWLHRHHEPHRLLRLPTPRRRRAASSGADEVARQALPLPPPPAKLPLRCFEPCTTFLHRAAKLEQDSLSALG